MAALTSDRNTEYSLGDLLAIPVAADAHVYAGSLVAVDAAGYAVPAADTAGIVLAGVATAEADNTDGAAGAVSTVVRRRGRYLLDSASALDASARGARVYVADDHSVAVAGDATNDVPAGVIDLVVGAGRAWVSIDAAVLGGREWAATTTTTAGA